MTANACDRICGNVGYRSEYKCTVIHIILGYPDPTSSALNVQEETSASSHSTPNSGSSPTSPPSTTESTSSCASLPMGTVATSAGSKWSKGKKERHPKFSAKQDLVMLREVAACKDYIASHGTDKKFQAQLYSTQPKASAWASTVILTPTLCLIRRKPISMAMANAVTVIGRDPVLCYRAILFAVTACKVSSNILSQRPQLLLLNLFLCNKIPNKNEC